VLKCIVAVALIAHAHYMVVTTPDPASILQGSLRPEDQYAHTIPAALLVLRHTAWAAGGYVLISSAFGLVGRLLQWAPAYSLYYCANVFGLGVCLLAGALPAVYAVAKDGYCLVVERACLALEADAACPYTIAAAVAAAAAGAGVGAFPPAAKTAGAAASGTEGPHALLLRRGLRLGRLTMQRWLAPAGENTSPCCYDKEEMMRQCSEFLGAAYTQAVVAAVLAALVMTQSAVSCFYLCCDCDRGA
jgi:hypothetical protein